jgi:hypothetical protein
MGSLTFQAVGDATIGTKTKTYTISDANMDRFAEWAIATFSPRPTNGEPNPTPLTVAQALAAWADWIVERTRQEIIQRERNLALGAVPPPPPFTST